MSHPLNLNRRSFITLLGLGAGATALSTTLTGCGSLETQLDYGWSGPSPDEKDMRLKVLAYAMLCPNPHNKQPWLIEFTGPDSLDLYVDPSRLLPATDPFYRQIHIGQGTFLETLAIAATSFGYRADIQYFPQGMYNNTQLQDMPVASIKLIEDKQVQTDPLFAHLLQRQSNKREYNNEALSGQHKSSLHEFHAENSLSSFTLVDSPEAKQKLENVLTQAMEIEVGNKARDEETIKMFRFNQQETDQFRDGFGVAQSGVSGLKKVLIENIILSRESVEKDPTAFGEQAVEMTQKSAASTATFGWMTTQGNSRLDQVKIGREYCRMNLKTTSLGLAQHPMSQVLQEYEEMLTLQEDFKTHFKIKKTDTVQMLFRLGKAPAVPHGPRRSVQSIFKAETKSA